MNLNTPKISALAKIVILILMALAGYFIWRAFQTPTKPRPEQALKTKSEQALTSPIDKTTNASAFSKERKIYNATDETNSSFFENINETAKTIGTKIKNEINAPAKTIKNTLSSTEIVLSLTADEFHFLYPDSFIKSLIDAQDLFIKNIDPSYKPLSKIETDTQVRLIEEKIVTALVSLNMLTREEAQRIKTTIRFTLPKIQLAELEKRKSSLNQYLNFTPLTKSNPKGMFLSGLLEKFYGALVLKAEAAICGACYTTPECYQIGAPTPTPGPSLFRAFCYCTGCYYGQGCLDFCVGRAAIFDPTTFICGCG